MRGTCRRCDNRYLGIGGMGVGEEGGTITSSSGDDDDDDGRRGRDRRRRDGGRANASGQHGDGDGYGGSDAEENTLRLESVDFQLSLLPDPDCRIAATPRHMFGELAKVRACVRACVGG